MWFSLRPRARLVRTPASTHLLLSTGNVPGMAASKNETLELTGALKLVGAEENILEAAFTYQENKLNSKKSSSKVEVTWACTSSPITLSQMPDCLDRLVTF